MKEKWLEVRKSADFAAISKKFNIHPVTARIMRNRELISEDDMDVFLHGDETHLHDPFLMKDMELATEIVITKISAKKRIRIINDYDVDGVCSGYILLCGLKSCGAMVDIVTPDRIKDGYGMNASLVNAAFTDGIDTIITCDNGIAAIDSVNMAKELGMTVIVTDHHNVPYRELEDGKKEYLKSNADAVVNPKQDDCPYPYKELCGASVAWKFIQALFCKMNLSSSNAFSYVEFAGFATVCDVMSLTGENRIIVKLALKMLRQTQNPGMLALIAESKLEKENIKAYHIGFILGPCINASGRLDTAKKALQLLCTASYPQARTLAAELVLLNEKRKELTEAGIDAAVQEIENNRLLLDKVMVVYLADCHESIAGIIAGKIRDRYYRPVFILAKTADGFLKGSGRSIEEYSMYDEMNKVSDVFLGFGGHPMAAGLSLELENLDAFRKRINENCSLTDDDVIPKIKIDVPVPIDYTSCEMVRELEILEPFGKDNHKPVFADRNVKIKRASILGKNKNVLKMELLSSSGRSVPGIYFGNAYEFLGFMQDKFGEEEVASALLGKENAITLSIVYDMNINEYNYVETPQVVIRNYC